MARCTRCGSISDGGANFCSSCGAPLEEDKIKLGGSDDSVIYSEPNDDPPSGTINVGYLVWSILNLILCCMPLGIAALILTVTANSAPSGKVEQTRWRWALILNLIGTLSIVFEFIFVAIIMVFWIGLF